MAHAPLLTNIGAEFFGFNDLESVTQMTDVKSHFEAPHYAKWRAFRETPDACYVGLCLPRFLGRAPFDRRLHPIREFSFEEVTLRHDDYLWCHASLAMVTRVADSFAQYRWCPNIVGPQSGGAVTDMPLAQFRSLDGIQHKIPTEIMLTEKREFELSEEGFIALTHRKDTDDACFFSANSVQKPKTFGNTREARELEINYRLGTQLPYMFIVSRLAHYIKVMQREQLGGYKTRIDLEREVNVWLRNFVADMDNPSMRVRCSKPLRKAAVRVEEVEGQTGWYKCWIELQPHMKYMGASFTLSLVGRLDRQ
jgi:type VI secretion system protein ImpC